LDEAIKRGVGEDERVSRLTDLYLRITDRTVRSDIESTLKSYLGTCQDGIPSETACVDAESAIEIWAGQLEVGTIA
jgi:hypothetical protein